MSQLELYLRLGFEHIFDQRIFTDILNAEGYDHLLFIIALCAIYTHKHIRPLLVLVTAFTIGHSVTLVMSTLGWISVSSDLIEWLIPVTIVIAAALNLFQSNDTGQTQQMKLRYSLAALFGLIHGMGFSNYLRSLLGDEVSLFIPLLGFNVGLELGQLLIVAMILLIGALARVLGLKMSWWVRIVSVIALVMALRIIYQLYRT